MPCCGKTSARSRKLARINTRKATRKARRNSGPAPPGGSKPTPKKAAAKKGNPKKTSAKKAEKCNLCGQKKQQRRAVIRSGR